MSRALAIGLVLLVGCGDDGGGGAKPPPPPAKAKVAKAKGRGAKVATLTVYDRIEDRVPEIERPTIRHAFRDNDFKPDSLGTENRDPFRSYVVAQVGGTLDTGTGPGVSTPITAECTQKEMVASNYSLRDLRLVGIVSQGVRKYAQFQDSKDYGHIVRRNDCLGREKAKVKDIGAGFVTLELLPDQGGSQAPRPPEERSIALYPEELKLGETDRERGDNPSNLTMPAMPAGGSTGPSSTDPVMPVPPPPSP